MNQLFGSDITRQIWGDPENVLLIYAGAAAEFALHPENNWLFYTGKLPANPLRRFQDTLQYQQRLFFLPQEKVPLVARHIKDLHRQVEEKKSKEQGESHISDHAYLQVFSMLIEYGITGWEYLNRQTLSRKKREEYFNDIHLVAVMMEIADFPQDYHHYQTLRTQIVVRELQFNIHTRELMESYRHNLGFIPSWLLAQFQARFIDPILSRRLGLKTNLLFGFLYRIYPLLRVPLLLKVFLQLLFKNQSGFSLEKPALQSERCS